MACFPLFLRSPHYFSFSLSSPMDAEGRKKEKKMKGERVLARALAREACDKGHV